MPPSGYDAHMELLLLALLGAGASTITIIVGWSLVAGGLLIATGAL
jgi:hypothetical protein